MVEGARREAGPEVEVPERGQRISGFKFRVNESESMQEGLRFWIQPEIHWQMMTPTEKTSY